MAKGKDEIRDEIEETRRQMGDTIEALAYKADVKSRAKESLHDACLLYTSPSPRD